ncbi:MAG: hypothetical protein R3300_19510 [Candidatus Promineifilaceae bacterium]|nr:hypothetical protein [Candidatus Promineifilaceae bacterium]
MSEAVERLREDLVVMEAMAAEMDEYLRSRSLFYPLGRADLPRLTLGGYLMRQHRLVALRDLLSEAEQQRLDDAMAVYRQALVEKVVSFEQRAHEELHARARQWSEYLKELRRPGFSAGDYYPSAVEPRLMIAVLLEKLSMPPYELDERVVEEIRVYDNVLRNHWQPGEFIWFEAWQPAYPPDQFWWLYGRPRSASK